MEHQRTLQNSVTLHRTSVAPASQTRWQGLGHDTMQLRNSSTISDTHTRQYERATLSRQRRHFSQRESGSTKRFLWHPTWGDANQAFDTEKLRTLSLKNQCVKKKKTLRGKAVGTRDAKLLGTTTKKTHTERIKGVGQLITPSSPRSGIKPSEWQIVKNAIGPKTQAAQLGYALMRKQPQGRPTIVLNVDLQIALKSCPHAQSKTRNLFQSGALFRPLPRIIVKTLEGLLLRVRQPRRFFGSLAFPQQRLPGQVFDAT